MNAILIHYQVVNTNQNPTHKSEWPKLRPTLVFKSQGYKYRKKQNEQQLWFTESRRSSLSESKVSNSQGNTRSNVKTINNSDSAPSTDNTVIAIIDSKNKPECESDYDCSDDDMVASIASKSLKTDPRNTTLKKGNTVAGLFDESESVCRMKNEYLATEIIEIFSHTMTNNSTL